MADEQPGTDETAATPTVINLDTSVPSPPPPPPRRRRTAAFVAAGATLAVLVGVGAYVAYQRYATVARPPERFTPASVAVFASVDLTADRDQTRKLTNLLSRVTGATPEGDTNGVARTLLERLNLRGVDVERDILSWLGPRIAVSVWFSNSEPYLLVSATTRSDEKAAAALERIRKTEDALGYVVDGGTALLAFGERKPQLAAEAAAAEARTSPLEGLATFREARAWLGDETLLTLWADMRRYTDLAMGMLTGSELGRLAPATSGSGASIVGVSATDDGLAARYRTFGQPARPGRLRDALARLADLPAGTEIGAALTVPEGPMVRTLVALLVGGVFVPGSVVPGGESLSDADRAEFNRLLAKDPAKLTKSESKRLEELLDKVQASLGGSSPGGPDAPLVPPGTGANDGLNGATVTVAASGPGGGDPRFRLQADAVSAQDAETFAKLAQSPLTTVSRDGTRVTVTSTSYAAGSGRLGEDATFRRLTADAPATTDLAAYLHLRANSARTPLEFTLVLVQGVEGADHSGVAHLVVT